jgi:hypothetical protein
MKDIKTYTERVTEVKDRHERELKRVAALASMYILGVNLAHEFDEGEATIKVDVDTWLGCTQVEIEIHLVEGQHINMVKPLLKLIAQTRMFRPATFYASKQNAIVHWDFWPRDGVDLEGSLRVNVWYSSSRVCRLEPTGETTPVMKLVCDGNDIPTMEGENDGGTEEE